LARSKAPISAKRKELIIWLAVIHLHQEDIDENYPTQKSVIEQAAKATGRKSDSIKSELSYYSTQNRASSQQIAYFWQLIDLVETLARSSGEPKAAFSLLLPAALVLSEDVIRI